MSSLNSDGLDCATAGDVYMTPIEPIEAPEWSFFEVLSLPRYKNWFYAWMWHLILVLIPTSPRLWKES